MSLTAANPLGESIFGVLQDATLQAAIGGRCYDSIPQDTPRPLVLIEIAGESDVRGLGTGNMPQVDVRLHTFSDEGSGAEASEINRQIVTLLKDAALTVTGFAQCGTVVYHETQAFPSEELHGVKVHEVVSLYTVWVEA